MQTRMCMNRCSEEGFVAKTANTEVTVVKGGSYSSSDNLPSGWNVLLTRMSTGRGKMSDKTHWLIVVIQGFPAADETQGGQASLMALLALRSYKGRVI